MNILQREGNDLGKVGDKSQECLIFICIETEHDILNCGSILHGLRN